MTISQSTLDPRPTLPPIHTLNLPLLSRPKYTHVKYQNYDNLTCSPLNHNGRHISTSSSHTSTMRIVSPPPSPALSDADSEINHSIPLADTKIRLIPCPLETADVVILVPPPNAYSIPTLSNYVPRTGQGQGLLLVGPALQHARQPRQLAKGARIHPYRVVRGENTHDSRRSSFSRFYPSE